MRSPELGLLRRLVEALLFEGLVSYSSRAAGARRRFSFVLGPHGYACEGSVGAFGRVRIDPASVKRVGPDGEQADACWRELARNMPADADVLVELLEELSNTVRLCTFNEAELSPLPTPWHAHGHEVLDSRLDEGHPYHPCFKARTGFSLEDQRRYGPEARGHFQLVWVAVQRQRLRQALPGREVAFWRAELGEGTWNSLQWRLIEENATFGEYGLLPVHPWQWARLASDLEPALSGRELICLGSLGDAYTATQSVRTLANVTDSSRAQLKLPLATRITSALRILPPESVCAAPAVSAWLRALVASDAYYTSQFGLSLLAEYAGSFYEDPDGGRRLSGHLAAIWREPVQRYLKAGEAAVPFNALTLTEPDERPFIHDWVTRHGVERWVRRLLDVCVLPIWHLLSRHGVAVEAHAQNMILVHRQGWPERLMLRDFHDSVEYAPDFVADPQAVPRFAEIDRAYAGAPPDRYFWMSSVEALRELFMDTVFVFNLSDLSHLLEACYGFSEGRLWAHVSRSLTSHARSPWGNPARSARLNCQAELVRAESLLTRRLNGGAGADWHHLVPNPLFAFEGEA